MERKMIPVVLAVALLFGIVFPVIAASHVDFTDIPDNWSKTAIVAAISNGLLAGSDNKIMPDADLKRSEMAAIVNRAFGASQKGDISKFTDIPAGEWYVDDLAKAVQMGTFKGDNGKMNPENPITRQEAFAVLARAFKLTATDDTSLDQFTDRAQVSDWAKPDLAALVAAGYVNGSGGRLNPDDNITRAEFAQVLYNILRTYIKTAGTYTSVADGNVMINVPGVTLKGVTVKGDLIIGDGVGTGDITLDAVKVEGRTVIRGGGKNSIHVINGSTINGAVVVDNVNNEVRIVTDQGTTVQKVEAGSQVVLEGSFSEVEVVGNAEGGAGIEVRGNVQSLTVETKADVTLTSGTVTTVEVAQTAAGTTINAAQGARVETVTANARTNITGSGTISNVEAKANDVKVDTAGTKVTADRGVTGVTAGGNAVTGDTTTTTAPATPATGGSGGGGSAGTPNPLSSGYTGDYTAAGAGTYGPASGTAAVSGSVTIGTAGVTLQNLTITGDLTFGAVIGSGDAYVNNVTVQGKTIVNGGGSHSIHIQGTSTLGVVEVDDQRSDQSEPINIEAEGTGSVAAVTVKSATPVKITPDTDTIGFVTAVDGSTITYGDTSNKDALLDKIVTEATYVLNHALSGTADSNYTVNDIDALVAGIIDTSDPNYQRYKISCLKYYFNPLEGVAGREADLNQLTNQLTFVQNTVEVINLRDHPENFVSTYYDSWFPGQPGIPDLGFNQVTLNMLWDVFSRYVALEHLDVNAPGTVANTLYGKLKTLQSMWAVDLDHVIVIDTNGNGLLDANDKVKITFKRRLIPGDATKGQAAIASLITADPRFGAGASVAWRDDATLDWFGQPLHVSECTITLGALPDTALLGGTITIPKDIFGSHIPDGDLEYQSQYGAYITNDQPLFDIVIGVPAQMIVPHVPAIDAGSVKVFDTGASNAEAVGKGDTIEFAFTCNLAQSSISNISNWVMGNDVLGTGTAPGEKCVNVIPDPNVTRLQIQLGNNPALHLGDTFTLSQNDVYDPSGLTAASDLQVTLPGSFSAGGGGGGVNQAPAANVLATQSMPSTGSDYILTGAQLASDPDGDPLSVTAAACNPAGIVNVSITGGNLVINPVSAGTASVTATVYDNRGAGVDVTFDMLVSPLNLTVTGETGTTATLAFTAPTGATAVTMRQSTDGEATWLDSATSTTLDQTSFDATVTGLVYNTAYTFKLVVTGGGLAGESNIVNLTTCSDISDFAETAKNGTTHTAAFLFTAPGGATTVNIKQSADGGNTWSDSTTSAPLDQSSTTATVTNLATGVSYKFKLYLVGGTHAGESNTVGFTM